jgi:hypothetical protein
MKHQYEKFLVFGVILTLMVIASNNGLSTPLSGAAGVTAPSGWVVARIYYPDRASLE